MGAGPTDESALSVMADVKIGGRKWEQRDRDGRFDWMLKGCPYQHTAEEPLVILGWANGASAPRTLLSKGADFRCLFSDDTPERRAIKMWERAVCEGMPARQKVACAPPGLTSPRKKAPCGALELSSPRLRHGSAAADEAEP